MKKENKRRKIFVDFDGTMATQDGEYSREIGKPIYPIINLIKRHLAVGNEVIIFTARASQWSDETEKSDIENFCKKYIGQILPITAIKEHNIDCYIDDKAVQVIKNTGEFVNVQNSTF